MMYVYNLGRASAVGDSVVKLRFGNAACSDVGTVESGRCNVGVWEFCYL